MEHQYKISKQLDPYIDAYPYNGEHDVYSEAWSDMILVSPGGLCADGVVIYGDEIFDEIIEHEIEIDAGGEATLVEYVELDDFVAPLTRDELIAGILNEEAIADLDSKYSNSLHLKDKIEKELSALDECCIYNFSEDYEYMIVHPSTYKVEFFEIEEDVPDGCSCYKTEQFISKGYDYNDYDRKIFHGYQFNEVPIRKFTELDFMLYYDEYPDLFYRHIDYPIDYDTYGTGDYGDVHNPTHEQDFIHLNVHSHYSIQKSILTIPEAVDKAVEDGMKGIALTDIGVMYGIKEFVDYCDKVNRKRKHEDLEPFKPIIGCEMYVAPRTMHDKEKGDERCTRLIVLAKNLTGYKNLIKLVSDSWIEGLMGETPRTDFFELEKHHEGLIICSACLNSVISRRILSGDLGGARNAVMWFKHVWGDDFYMEIQRHEVTDSDMRANRKVFPLQQNVNKVLLELAREYNVKIVCSNNCHFIDEEDAEALDRLHCLAADKELDDPSRKLCTKQEWLKTRKEMNDAFSDIPEALDNTLEILDKVDFYSIEEEPYALLPHFPIPESFGTEEEWRKRFSAIDIVKEFTSDENGNNPMTDDQALAYIKEIKGKWWNIDRMYRVKFQSDYLTKLTYDGAERIYGTLTPQIEERLRFELHQIKINGFPEYFLFVQDYVNAAQKDLNVWVGPGRGSAVGSLVNYCLGITKVDPLKFGLLFERFYRLNHIALPDIDIDFDADGRGKVLQWIKEKYGEENCANIVTFAKMSSWNAIKGVARMEKLPFGTAEALCQMIPVQRYSKDTLNNLLNSENYDGTPEYPELVAAQNCSDPQIANTINYASKIDGTVCATGIHACGFVISPDPIVNHVPLAVSDDPDFPDEKTPITQYDGHTIESTGLIKFDFLGLWTLTEMKECLRLIKENKGINIDLDHLPLDDEKTFRLYQEGNTAGTFQFESSGMQKYLRELHPTVFDDLVAMNALYRPMAMDFIPVYIARKNGEEEITYDLPIMEKYLKETQGIPVYQEQIMHLAREIAGFTRYQSDVLRIALGRRFWGVLETLKERFIEGGQKKGYDTHILEKIWSDWDKFGSYFFNKSHAVAYTLIAYQTAYLKAHYPEEYMSALIQRRQHDDNEVTRLMEECKRMDIKSLSANVNDIYQVFLTPNTDESIDNYSTYDGTICPHCGNKIEKFDHYCYYSWDGGEWSDLRHEAPQVMVPSLVQLCPNCGNHFAMNNENIMLNDTSMVNFVDPVDFPALIHGALKYCMPTSEFEWDSPEQEFNQRMRFLWAYNDYFYRNKSEHPEPDDMAKLMHHHNIMELQKIIESPLMQCDLLRQAGDFDECLSQIDALMPQTPEDAVPLLKLIWQKVIIKDRAPFKMNERYQGGLTVKVTCTQCFSGVGNPNWYNEGSEQFQYWHDVYKEGLKQPVSNSYIDIDLYKDAELLGHVHGILTDSQTERLCTQQRANDDDFGYPWLRTKEEILSLNNKKVQKSECDSPFTLIDSDTDDGSNDGSDDLPF